MNSRFFMNKIEGNWIIQSTNYSLLKNTISTSINEVIWKEIQNVNNDIEIIIKNIITKFSINNISIYIIESSNHKRIKKFYKFFLYNEKINKGSILKLNHTGNIVSKASFSYRNNQYFHIKSKYNDFDITENVYFINPNLKIIKSVIKKNETCIGISFSSEIRIN
uniref:hypothetical protein n=1 Tax=Lithothamnion corallioides TaxID=1277934 RepID=UPI0023F0E48F|nr:hypothetical protein P6G75_pgp041 [Lithothamnion corallioides]WEA77134.1 hypothetical protein [Lithothamnion corallioides]